MWDALDRRLARFVAVRKDWPGSAIFQPPTQLGAVIGLVAEALRCCGDEPFRGTVIRFAAGQEDGEKAGPERVRGPSCCARLFPPFLPAGERCADVRGADHPDAGRSSISGQFPEQIFPDSAPRPADKSVADRRRWATGRAIPPPLNPANIRRQARLKSASTAHRSAKTHPCSQFQFLPAKQSLSYCQRRKIYGS